MSPRRKPREGEYVTHKDSGKMLGRVIGTAAWGVRVDSSMTANGVPRIIATWGEVRIARPPGR